MSWWTRLRNWHRARAILKSCGNVCYCPECRNPLNDTSEVIMYKDGTTYMFTCVQCDFVSIFDYSGPVPIYRPIQPEAVMKFLKGTP